jgi:hypothetical protein
VPSDPLANTLRTDFRSGLITVTVTLIARRASPPAKSSEQIDVAVRTVVF